MDKSTLDQLAKYVNISYKNHSLGKLYSICYWIILQILNAAAIAFSTNTVATLDRVKIIGATTPVLDFPSGGFTAEVESLTN